MAACETQPGGAQVDSHLRVPVLERQGIDRLLAIDRRHVDEDVQPPEFSDRLFDNAPARLGLLQIGLDDERAPRQPAKRGGRFLRFGAGGPVYDGDVRALRASSVATTAPIRRPPVIRATLSVSSTPPVYRLPLEPMNGYAAKAHFRAP